MGRPAETKISTDTIGTIANPNTFPTIVNYHEDEKKYALIRDVEGTVHQDQLLVPVLPCRLELPLGRNPKLPALAIGLVVEDSVRDLQI